MIGGGALLPPLGPSELHFGSLGVAHGDVVFFESFAKITREIHASLSSAKALALHPAWTLDCRRRIPRRAANNPGTR